MSWLFSQALVAEYLAGTCSDGEQSSQLNVIPTPHKFWRNDKTMDCSNLSRFGLMCAVLTADRGAELLTSYLEASRARTSALPGVAQESTASAADCGHNLRGSLARYDPSSHTLKTAQTSLIEDLTGYSVTLPRSGTMRSGSVYQRATVVRRTNGIGSGFLPTPTASAMPCEGTVRLMRAQYLAGNYTLAEASAIAGRDVRKAQGKVQALKMHPTPCARDFKGERSDAAIAKTGRNQATNSLPDALQSAGFYGPMNPTFPEWLMGWPIGWTELKPLETGKFREWQRKHSQSFGSVADGD